ncbi:hypothetical protein [Palpita vitrealis nucleopolyhedrovirus]|uniref:Ac55 n=1 Tax=Palpita vitrealis nucleopolyhedrovirus TaxID=2951960 RepID=A0AAE9RYS1_9ABAC|nr:hypothetical protein [Palpita vitrealis nucleopolyhedrovirus]
MKKVALGKIIENIVDNKYKKREPLSSASFINVSSNSNSEKLNLSEYYKNFQANKVGQQSTYDVVGKRDYTKFDKLVKKL